MIHFLAFLHMRLLFISPRDKEHFSQVTESNMNFAKGLLTR